MARENSYFILSGFISLSLFSFFLFLFFYMMFSSSKIDTFALTKDNYISISLESIQTPTTKTKKELVVPEKEPEVVQEIKEEIKDISIDDLFSDVWTKKIKIEKKEKKINNKRLALIKKKINTNSSKVVKKNTASNEEDIISDENKKSSSGSEVNEYLAKIQAIVYKHFTPPANSQGYIVKAVIELSAYGKVKDFRILNYSSNQALNQECDKIKGRLVGVLFPSNPENKSFTIPVILKSDED